MGEAMVVIKGQINRREFEVPFQLCACTLKQMGVSYCVNTNVGHAGGAVDFFLFFQSYPNEFPPSGLAQLRRENPFAPFFFVLGAGCEGMLRTAGPIDSPFYVYAHAWNENYVTQLRLFLNNQPSLFSLPTTAEQDEVALFWTKPSKHPNPATEKTHPSESSPPSSPYCLILTRHGPFGNDPAMNQLIADEQRRIGCRPVFSATPPFDGIIVADLNHAPKKKILESIKSLRRQFADNDFTVYVDSPRIEEKSDYIQTGVTRVLAKLR